MLIRIESWHIFASMIKLHKGLRPTVGKKYPFEKLVKGSTVYFTEPVNGESARLVQSRIHSALKTYCLKNKTKMKILTRKIKVKNEDVIAVWAE